MRNSIIGPLNNNPQGRFMEGIIDDTSKPGTWMEVVPSSAEVSGRLHYRHYQPGADKDPRELIILLEDPMQGGVFSAAYVAGTRCFLYSPFAGDEMNVLCAGATGTGSLDAFHVGDRLVGQSSSGKFIKDAVATDSCPVVCNETLTQSPPDTDTWVFVRVTGGGN